MPVTVCLSCDQSKTAAWSAAATISYESIGKPVIALQVRIADFHSETVRCTVSGSGFPGLARQRQLAELTAGRAAATALLEEAPVWGKAETGRLLKGTIESGRGGAGGLTHTQLYMLADAMSYACNERLNWS